MFSTHARIYLLSMTFIAMLAAAPSALAQAAPQKDAGAYATGKYRNLFVEDGHSRKEIQAKIATQSALYPAERYFQYSNLGLTLVGETVAAVSGESYAEYAKANVLAPLVLNDTRTFMPMALYGKRLAVGYGALKRDGTRDLVKPFNTRGVTPAAGYTSTVEDLGKFASWQFRLLRTGPGAPAQKTQSAFAVRRLTRQTRPRRSRRPSALCAPRPASPRTTARTAATRRTASCSPTGATLSRATRRLRRCRGSSCRAAAGCSSSSARTSTTRPR